MPDIIEQLQDLKLSIRTASELDIIVAAQTEIVTARAEIKRLRNKVASLKGMIEEEEGDA